VQLLAKEASEFVVAGIANLQFQPDAVPHQAEEVGVQIGRIGVSNWWPHEALRGRQILPGGVPGTQYGVGFQGIHEDPVCKLILAISENPRLRNARGAQLAAHAPHTAPEAVRPCPHGWVQIFTVNSLNSIEFQSKARYENICRKAGRLIS